MSKSQKIVEQLTLFAVDSRAKTSPTPARALGSKAKSQDSGGKCTDSSASSSQLGLLLKMSMLSEIEVLTGSTLRWKNWDTKYGVSGFQLVPSEPPTREGDCGLWATPRASDKENRTTKPTPAQLAGRHGAYLAVQVLWSTPKASEAERGVCQAEAARRSPALQTQVEMWSTPTATEHKREVSPGTISRKSPPLATQVQWPTPAATEYGGNQDGAAEQTGQPIRPSLSRPAQGESNTNGKNLARLNPRWVLQLMGFPANWLSAPAAMRSYRPPLSLSEGQFCDSIE